MEESVDIKGILNILRRRIITIVITSFCVFVLTALALIFLVKPTYEATGYLLVGELKTEEQYYGERQEIDMLLASSIDFIKSPIILNAINGEFNIPHDELIEKITINNNDNSQIINVVVRDNDPQIAKGLASTITETTVETMNGSFDMDAIQVLSNTEETISLTRVDNVALNLVIGFVVALIMGGSLALMRDYFDDSIKSYKEIEVLGLTVLGEVDLKDQPRSQKTKANKGLEVAKRKKGGKISAEKSY
ncbi:YveK family protein [Thalassorhabdus alkalitolerans]|uniref:YveK family protein n=1 Tax=Thalassorhabdus alkalitolerans TaxID=2282697 RepID=A0ABW0YR83_9BACI